MRLRRPSSRFARALIRLAPAALIALLLACDDAAGPPASPRLAAFDRLWETFDREYSYFAYKGIDWDALRAEHRPAAEAAGTDEALLEAVRSLTAPLRDVHVWLRDGNQVLPTYTPDRHVNWNREAWSRRMAELGGWQQEQTNWGWARIGDVGYLAFGGWNPQQVKIEDVDRALEALRGVRAMIIDVRPNGGGDSELAFAVAGRFAASAVVAEHVRYRDGPDHDDLGPLFTKRLEPRGAWQFTDAVVVLAGRGCFSSNESFVSGMRELPHVTVMGDTTGGSSGNPGIHELGIGGWRYAVPRWIAYTADMRVIEWSGIPPDVVVPTADPDFETTDPVLDAALERVSA